MQLFCLNGHPIRFNIIDIERELWLFLKDAIEASGGDVTDDEESIVKFTCKRAFGKIKYQRAKIYNVDFILKCIERNEIIDPEPFRLCPKIPGDEYHMQHLIYGRCASTRSDNAESIHDPNGSARSLTTPRTDNDSEESALDLKICASSLAGGDAAAANARTDSHEKRACDVKQESTVQTKMQLAAVEESVVENAHLPRSLQNRTRKNDTGRSGASQEKNSLDSKDSDVGNVASQEESVVFIDPKNCQTPAKIVLVELSSSPEASKSPGAEPVISKAPKRKLSYENSSDEAGARSKRTEENGERDPLEHNEKSATKNNKRKSDEREICKDEAKAMRKKEGGRIVRESSEEEQDREERRRRRRRERERVEEGEEEKHSSERNKNESPADESNNWSRKKKGMQRLFKNCKTLWKDSAVSPKGGIVYFESSDSSVDLSLDQQKKRSGSISDDNEKKDDPGKEGANNFNKPGLSGVVSKVKKDFYIDIDDDDDDESTDEKAGDGKQCGMLIKTDLDSTAGRNRTSVDNNTRNEQSPAKQPASQKQRKSRGREWRARLTDKRNNIRIRHGPFNSGERTMMVNYLVKTKTINKAKGYVVWKAMINDGYLKHRTPQSLHNHFKKMILPHIEHYGGLKPEDMDKFLLLKTEKNDQLGK